MSDSEADTIHPGHHMTADQTRDVRTGHCISNTEAGHAEQLGKSSYNDDVLALANQVDHRAVIRVFHDLVVGLVDHHDGTFADIPAECAQCVAVQRFAGCAFRIALALNQTATQSDFDITALTSNPGAGAKGVIDPLLSGLKQG